MGGASHSKLGIQNESGAEFIWVFSDTSKLIHRRVGESSKYLRLLPLRLGAGCSVGQFPPSSKPVGLSASLWGQEGWEGRREAGIPCLGLLMLLRGGGQSGVCLSSASGIRIWDPTLGLEFEEGATRSGADVESRKKSGYLAGRLEVETLVQAGEVERRTVLRV